jgi:hypothetical protein
VSPGMGGIGGGEFMRHHDSRSKIDCKGKTRLERSSVNIVERADPLLGKY